MHSTSQGASSSRMWARVLTSGILAIFVTGCVTTPSKEQLAIGSRSNVLLGRGGSAAIYSANFVDTLKVLRRVMKAESHTGSGEETVWVIDPDNTKHQYSYHDRTFYLDLSSVPKDWEVVGYFGVWYHYYTKGDVRYPYEYAYHVSAIRNSMIPTVEVHIQLGDTLACRQSDYNEFLKLHQKIREAGLVPIPCRNPSPE